MKIGVVGSGNMGVQLSAHLLHYGHEVTMIAGDMSRTDSIYSGIKRILQKKYSEQFTDNVSITITDSYDPVKDCRIVIETSKEDVEYKRKIIGTLSDHCDEETIVATNTSSISISVLAKGYKYPERFIGCHFFNPVSKMSLVEIVIGERTSEETYRQLRDFVKTIEKKPVKTMDSPGFIVNRLLLPQINNAIKMLESEIATIEDIDLAVKLGLNHPMGPFELADYIGLDVCYAILQELYENTNEESYRPSKLLLHYIDENKLGIKTGEGFYKYNTK